MSFRFALIWAVLVCSLQALFGSPTEGVYRVADVPNVQLYDSTQFVSDPQNYLSTTTTNRINSHLASLRRDFGVEMVVVVLPSIGDEPIESFALELLRQWGVGSSKDHSGLVLLVAIEDRTVRIETGYGMEGVLPDATAISIIDQYLLPHFRRGAYEEGISEAVAAIAKTIKEGDFDPATRTDRAGELLRSGDKAKQLRRTALAILGFLGVLLLIGAWGAIRRDKSKELGPYLVENKDRVVTRWALALLVICFPLALVLVVWYLGFYRKKILAKARQCPHCGNLSFRKIPFANVSIKSLLTPSQQVEATLGSVLYGGGTCMHCGYKAVYRIREPYSAYSRCPQCYTKAYKMVRKEALTIGRMRYIRRHFRCFYCDHTDHKDERDNSEEAVATGFILGNMLGGRRGGFGGGGGFHGGGFGGGSGGGGGATGRW